MNTRLILISRDGPSCQAYRDALTRLSITYDHLASLDAIPDYIRETSYNGILLDVATSARASHEEKERIRELSDQFPLLRLKWEDDQEEIRTMLFGQALGAVVSLEMFVKTFCAYFVPRPIRIERRKKLNFNVLLSRSSEFENCDTRRGNIVEISSRSCFVYTTEDWVHSETVWIRIVELGENESIEARVAWITHWGVPMQLPGIELEFVHMSFLLRDQLNGWTSNQMASNE